MHYGKFNRGLPRIECVVCRIILELTSKLKMQVLYEMMCGKGGGRGIVKCQAVT